MKVILGVLVVLLVAGCSSTAQITNNQELTDIKKIMGFKSQVKHDELRYGSILLMMDADEDGSHIKGLFINFLDYFYPHLLEIKGFLKILVTPVIKAINKNETINFANLRAYSTWKEKNDQNKWNIKYYKGLGTSTSKEAQEYFQNLENNTISILDTQKQGSNPDILLAFAKDKVNDRKNWLINYNTENILQIEPPTTITIKDFIHRELIHFSNFDNIRSIPSIIDGFKPSQRKVIYAAMKRNLLNEMKVAQLASAVAEITSYHHGEQSLVATIINLAQDFVGSNNLNLLEPIGQFGSRLLGGKDHSSARYIFTKLIQNIYELFRKEDNNLLEYLNDDGYQIEPKYFLPVIPVCLINGAEGIGTGFSTYIPNFNPVDIIEYLKAKLTSPDKPKIKLEPYYKNFKGKIIKYDDTTWISEGILEFDEKQITITELPIKLWTSDYKEFLEELIDTKDSPFKNFQNLSSDMDVKFIIKIDTDKIEYIKKLYETKDEMGLNNLYKLLKLYKTLKISNLTLYDTNYKLKTYNNVYQIINEFFDFRLEYYEKRRLELINIFEKDNEIINNQIKFLELILNDKDKLFNKDENEMIAYLKNKGIKQKDDSYDYLLNIPFKKLNKDNHVKLNQEYNNIKNKIKDLKNKTNKDIWLEDLNLLAF